MAKKREPQRPGFAAHGGANAFEPPLGKPLAGHKVPSATPTSSVSDPLARYLKKQRANRSS